MTPDTSAAPDGAVTPASTAGRPAYAGVGIWGGVGLSLLFLFIAGCVQFEITFVEVLAGVRLNPSFLFLLTHLAGAAAVLWVGLPRSGLTPAEAFPLRHFPPGLIPGILVALAGLFMVGPWLFPAPPEFLLEFARQIESGGFLPALLVIGVEAPIMEELVFRGLLLGALRRRYSTATAAVVSTALFVLFHGNFTQGVAALAIGSLACWLVVRTGSLLPGMVVHVAWNSSLQVVGALTSAHGAQPSGGTGATGEPWLLLAGALAMGVGVLALWWQLRALPRPAAPAPAPHPRPATVRLASALVLPLALVIVTGSFTPMDQAMKLMGVPEDARRRLRPDPTSYAGCYELSSLAGPLSLLDDTAGLRLRLTLKALPGSGGPTHYAMEPIASARAVPDEGRYWFVDSRRGLRIVRLRPGGSTIVRVALRDSVVDGGATRYDAKGAVIDRPHRVVGRRVACPPKAAP